MYLEQLSENYSLNVLLEVIRLADMYCVEGLVGRCAQAIRKLATGNSAQEICEMILLLRDNGEDIMALNNECLDLLVP